MSEREHNDEHDVPSVGVKNQVICCNLLRLAYQFGQRLDRLLLSLDLDAKASQMCAKLVVRALFVAVVAVDI